MWSLLWPVIVVVGSNTIYHICTKSAQDNVNTFATLFVTYAVAAICSLIMYFITEKNGNIIGEFARLNWVPYALGVAIVGLEFGFIYMYKNGWQVSVGNLVAALALAVVLFFVGIIAYKETHSIKQYIGIGVCIVGLILINL